MPSTLVFTGIILPPTPDEHISLTHACTEFTKSEAAELVKHMHNLPLLYDHNDGDNGTPELRVGKVLNAWVDDNGGVRVMAALNENTEVGRQIRARVANKELPELSLSHKFELYHTGDRLLLTKHPLEVRSGLRAWSI